MDLAMFKKFMAFFIDMNLTPTWDDLKVYIKGRYTIRIGGHVFQYNWKTDKIEEA